MSNLSTILTSTFSFFTKGLVKNSLKGAGLGLGSYMVLQGLYDTFVSHIRSNFQLGGDILYAFNLSQVDTGLSIVLSAIAVRMYLDSQKVFLRKITQ